MTSAKFRPRPRRDRGWRRSDPAGAIELLNRHWHNLPGGASRHSCPNCAATVSAGEYAVHQGGELYHADCAPKPRQSPDAAVRMNQPGVPRSSS